MPEPFHGAGTRPSGVGTHRFSPDRPRVKNRASLYAAPRWDCFDSITLLTLDARLK
jgi:hypothetical protein